MEIIYLVTFFDAIGGCAQGLISVAVAYISDITTIESRTSRVSTAMSLWYFGGPLGNFIGALAIQYGGINLALTIVFLIHLLCLSYITLFIKETHGPFAIIKPVDSSSRSEGTLKKEDVTKTRMLLDFFNWRRFADTFRTAFRPREGYTRIILFAVIISNMIRRAARGFFMYMFVRRALNWEAALYTYWTSYRTLIAALGSLVIVPILIRFISITDPVLIVVGSLSTMGEYCCYGFVSGAAMAFFMWLGPLAGLISNASIIAQKSLATKLVSATEKGRVSSVMSATQSLMPMVGYAMYTPIYHQTVESFAEAQFFFGASLAAIIMITFLAIQLSSISEEMKKADPEKEKPKEENSGDEVKSNDILKLSAISNTKNSCSVNYQLTKESTKELGKNDTTKKKESICYGNKMSDSEIMESENVNDGTTSHGDVMRIRDRKKMKGN